MILFEKYNPEIALTVLHVDVDAKIFLIESKIWAGAHKSIKQLYVSNLYLKKKEKKRFCY